MALLQKKLCQKGNFSDFAVKPENNDISVMTQNSNNKVPTYTIPYGAVGENFEAYPSTYQPNGCFYTNSIYNR